MASIFVPVVINPDDVNLPYDDRANLGQIDWGNAQKTYSDCKNKYDEVIQLQVGGVYEILEFANITVHTS